MDVEIVYDKKYDILYLIFGKPTASEAVWVAKGVYLRRDMVTDKLKGAIIEDYSSQDRDHLSYILPYPLNKHLPIIGEFVDIDNMNYLNSAYCVKLMVVRTNRIQAMANFSKEELITYQQLIEAEYVHNTTAIEGNKLSFNAVIGLLYDDGMKYSMRGITEREIVEVSNYKQVKIYREERHTNKVTLDFIRRVHSHVMANIHETPGEFRTHDNIRISGVDKRLTTADSIVKELQNIIDDYYYNIKNGKHPFEQTMLFHYKFESIHPFADGNGRTGREILNFMLIESGYPIMLFTGHRMDYITLLHMGDLDEMYDMVKGFTDLYLRDYGDHRE